MFISNVMSHAHVCIIALGSCPRYILSLRKDGWKLGAHLIWRERNCSAQLSHVGDAGSVFFPHPRDPSKIAFGVVSLLVNYDDEVAEVSEAAT